MAERRISTLNRTSVVQTVASCFTDFHIWKSKHQVIKTGFVERHSFALPLASVFIAGCCKANDATQGMKCCTRVSLNILTQALTETEIELFQGNAVHLEWYIGLHCTLCTSTPFCAGSILVHLCGLVVTVLGYRSRGPGFDSWRYQIFWEIVGLERGPLSLVRVIEELFEWKSSGAPVKKTELTGGGIRCSDYATPSIHKSWH
jgi:hypothetical protein